MKVTSLHTKPEVVLSHRCCHREIVYDVITPLRVARFGRNLGFDSEWHANYCDLVKIANGRRIPAAISKNVLRRIFVCFSNAVWASASRGFHIVSYTCLLSLTASLNHHAFLQFPRCFYHFIITAVFSHLLVFLSPCSSLSYRLSEALLPNLHAISFFPTLQSSAHSALSLPLSSGFSSSIW